MSTAAPSAQRIWDHCEALARLSEMEGGLTRVFLSKEQKAASELVLGWMRSAGMTARLDAIGNVVGRYEGERPGVPCLMMGSHLDTVRDAGKYDGMLGVIAAVECVHALNARRKRLPFALEIVGFADEEGVRFNATLLGSRAVAGTFRPEVLDNRQPELHAQGAAESGLDPEAGRRRAQAGRDPATRSSTSSRPVLEAEGLPVGAVTAINGATRFAVEIDGMAGHAHGCR
jgi:allantoate deiminase